MTGPTLRAAAAAYRRLVRSIRQHVPPDSENDIVAAFDALQRECLRERGWVGLARCWAAELASILRLWMATSRTRPFTHSPTHPFAHSVMPSLRHDVRDAWRALRRARGYTATVTLMLALGIGVNTAVFSVLDALLFKSLPYADADRIMVVAEWPLAGGNWTMAPTAYAHWRATSRSFSHLEARLSRSYALLDGGDPESVRGARVTAGYFDLLGVAAARGRTFQPGDASPGQPCVAVVGHRLWTRRFGADPDAIGRMVRLSGTVCTLIGVLPPETAFDRGAPELYTPLVFTPAEAQSEGRILNVLGRLRADVTAEQARGEIEAIAAAFNANRGAAGRQWTSLVTPWRDILIRTSTRQLVWVLFGAVALVLLIACANVASLALARAADRSRELAVRAALGAGRARLFRALVVESLLLAVVGGAIGIGVGHWALRAFVALVPAGTLPPEVSASLDMRTLMFTALVSIVTGVLAGALPAWQAGRHTMTATLAAGGRSVSGSRRSGRLQSTLLVVELALAMTLVTGAALLVASFIRIAGVDPGFDAARVLTLRLATPDERYPTANDVAAFYSRALGAIRAVPGVRHAGAVTSLPLNGWLFGTRFSVDGVVTDPERPPSAHIQHATDGYVEALGLRMAAGRAFTAADTPQAAPVAIVNETFVRRFISDGRAVGRRLRLDSAPAGVDNPPLEIVGIVGDVKTGGLGDAALATPEIYVPHSQAPAPVMSVAILGAQDDPMSMLADMRTAIRSVDAELPVSDPLPMDERLGLSLHARRFRTLMIAAFAGLAGLLACLGVYAVRARAIAGRRRELGIRVALGATRRQVVGLALGQGLRLAAIGLGLGLVTSILVSSLIAQWLFDTRASDPLILASAVALLGAAALLASWIPARRAGGADPVKALRDG